MTALIRACAALSLFSASSSLAQSASLTWQVSSDAGATWSSAAVVNSASTVLIRSIFAWEVTNSWAFGGSQFDATVVNAASGDAVTDIYRPFLFSFATQNLVARRYSSGIKIDPSSDTAEPGAGIGWVNPGQNLEDGFGGPLYTRDNPVMPFFYTLNVSDEVGTRTISNIFNPITGRALSIAISQAGAQYRFSAHQVTINTATVTVIPTPAVAAFIPGTALIACRRRRRSVKGLR